MLFFNKCLFRLGNSSHGLICISNEQTLESVNGDDRIWKEYYSSYIFYENTCKYLLNILVIANCSRWFLLFISILVLHNGEFQSRTVLNSHERVNVFDHTRSGENRYITFSAQLCRPPVRFLTAIYNALHSLYFERKNAYGCRLIGSIINLSARITCIPR